MTSFFEALEQGYSPEQVIGYLSKAIPQMSPMIRKAQKAGYPAQQILGFLSKNFETEERRGMSESEIHAANRRSDAERVKYGLQLGAAAIATPLVARAAQGALARALPSSLTQGAGLPGIGSDNLGQPSHLPQQLQQLPTEMQSTLPQSQNISSQPPVSGNIPQQLEVVQPEIKPINFAEILNKYPGFESKINDMIASKNTPEAIAQYFKQFNPTQTKKIEKEAGVSIDDIISKYISKKQTEKPQNMEPKVQELNKSKETQEPTSLQSQGQELDVSQKETEVKPIEKGHNVLSPQGVGEVKEIRNGQAIVEIDGKKHKVREDELESEPTDLEPAVRHILNSIPEKMKSSAFESTVHINLPSEEEGKPGKEIMLVKFYNGKWGWYLDVPENLYSDIAMGVYEPKTSGKTGIAEYKPGVIDSRGAGFQEELIKNPKYAKDKKDKTWGYATTKYNALEMIQELIHKISKEEYDEEGNLIQRKKRKKRD